MTDAKVFNLSTLHYQKALITSLKKISVQVRLMYAASFMTRSNNTAQVLIVTMAGENTKLVSTIGTIKIVIGIDFTVSLYYSKDRVKKG